MLSKFVLWYDCKQNVKESGPHSTLTHFITVKCFSCSNKDSQVDVMNVFSTLLGFLQLLLPPTRMQEGAEQDQRNETYTQLNRKIHIPYSKLKSLLKLDKPTENHPFTELEKFFKVCKIYFSPRMR